MPKKKATRSTATRKSSTDPLKRKYRKNYLSKVVVQLKFAEPLADLKGGPSEKFNLAMLENFRVQSYEDTYEHQVLIVDGKPKTTQRYFKKHLYKTVAGDKTAVLTDEALTVEYQTYQSFSQLKKDFLGPLAAIFSSYENVQGNRLGLRYIDTIDLRTEKDPCEWADYLLPNLLSSFAVPEDPSKMVRCWHVVETREDTVHLRFQYGMHNPDYPAPIQRKVFTLDHDAFTTGLLDYDAIKDYLETLRATVKRSFEAVITDKFRRHMGVIA